MTKHYGSEWKTAVNVIQHAQPPHIADGAEAMTVVIEYPPGSAGTPPHRHPRRDAVRARRSTRGPLRRAESRWTHRARRNHRNVRREVFAGQCAAGFDERPGRALEDDAAAVVARARTEVDDPVGVSHHRLVMFDRDDRFAGVDEAVQQAEQLIDVGEVQAGGGFVED